MNIIEKIDLITKDKKELFNELSLEEFLKVCSIGPLYVREDGEDNEEIIQNNFSNCERFTVDETKKIFDYYLDKFIQLQNKEFTNEKDKLKEIKRIWPSVIDTYRLDMLFNGNDFLICKFPSLLIHLHKAKLFDLNEIKTYIEKNSVVMNDFDWNDDLIDIVKFAKKHEIHQEIKQTKANKYVSHGGIFNPSVFVDITPKFNAKTINLDLVGEMLNKGYIIEWDFSNIDLAGKTIELFNSDYIYVGNYALSNLYNFKSFLNKLDEIGQKHNFDNKRLDNRLNEILKTLSDDDKKRHAEVLNFLQSKPKKINKIGVKL